MVALLKQFIIADCWLARPSPTLSLRLSSLEVPIVSFASFGCFSLWLALFGQFCTPGNLPSKKAYCQNTPLFAVNEPPQNYRSHIS